MGSAADLLSDSVRPFYMERHVNSIEFIEAIGLWIVLPACGTVIAIVAMALHALGKIDNPRNKEADDDNGG